MLHADHPRLYFVGLFQPLGCIWPLSDHQARIAAADIVGDYHRPDDLPAAIARELAHPHFRFQKSTCHSTEVVVSGHPEGIAIQVLECLDPKATFKRIATWSE